MYSQEVKQAIEQQLDNVEVVLDGSGCDFCLNIISDELAALSPVKRQQAVYAVINPWIADGRVHAGSMKFFSKDAWASRA